MVKTFHIGERVQAGEGEDYDVGTVAPSPTIAKPNQVYVSWDSGVATWTPIDLLMPLLSQGRTKCHGSVKK